MTVYISMCRRDVDRRNWRDEAAATLPIIASYPIGLGQLMFHNSHRAPEDAVYVVETIGQ